MNINTNEVNGSVGSEKLETQRSVSVSATTGTIKIIGEVMTLVMLIIVTIVIITMIIIIIMKTIMKII